ncbi:RNA-binding domain-containing protein [Aspergillus heteromorphus CBS 117.55]|uniref:RNA-binding domain-containing protein n=1 Tax=Aspergillus heteromorphus CBS 117.55 TaxID=1448321 RepID=A0A317VL86_9EURO|nr:RNA-binding domain-containing protein [Aspergillus heteromorphus CBS 117.55]PWY75154.1 RNA-binding domain-containing protein [Aspergillus heteromorphus CBS 117.55]
MDRSLDEIIAERPQKQNRGRRPPQGQGQSRAPQGRRQDGVRKPYNRDDRPDLDLDWVHDKYEDDRDARPSRAPRRPRGGDRYSPEAEHGHSSAPTGAKLRVENIHYDITETDLEDLFARIGPIKNVSLVYDRAGRSEGVAFVTYGRVSDARAAISEFDGANAKGQPIRLTLISTGAARRDRNPFDNVERPKGSLFDRVERPRDRNARSLSPDSRSISPDGGRRRRGGGRRGGAGAGASSSSYRRSDVSKPAPEHIDRYVPGQRSPTRRPANGRRQPENRGGDGRRTVNGRPRKTQEELDQEMDDYWGSGNTGAGAAEKESVPEPQQTAPAPAAAPAGDDDIDMIE